MTTRHVVLASMALVLATFAAGCGDDDGSEAVQRGVGAECAVDADCTEEGQRCLTQFRGGYCGVEACTSSAACPAGSACVMHDDGVNYCFLVCEVKADCNIRRTLANESNCSSTSNPIDEDGGGSTKTCTPPSGI